MVATVPKTGNQTYVGYAVGIEQRSANCGWFRHEWTRWETFDPKQEMARFHNGYVEVQKRKCFNCGKTQLRRQEV